MFRISYISLLLAAATALFLGAHPSMGASSQVQLSFPNLQGKAGPELVPADQVPNSSVALRLLLDYAGHPLGSKARTACVASGLPLDSTASVGDLVGHFILPPRANKQARYLGYGCKKEQGSPTTSCWFNHFQAQVSQKPTLRLSFLLDASTFRVKPESIECNHP